MKMKIPFRTFKEEVFDIISKKDKNILFYWSLYDPTTSWELSTKPFLPNFKEGKKKVLAIFRKNRSFYKEYIIKKKEEFYKQFVCGEFLPNYLVAAKIEEKIKGNFDGRIDETNLGQMVFPDIIVKDTKIDKIHIEIKCIPIGGQLKDTVIDDVIPKINKNKKKYNNFLLLLLFPFSPKDHRLRVSQLTKGYYLFENLMGAPVKKRKALCECFAESGQKEHSLDNLGERILENFNKRIRKT